MYTKNSNADTIIFQMSHDLFFNYLNPRVGLTRFFAVNKKYIDRPLAQLVLGCLQHVCRVRTREIYYCVYGRKMYTISFVKTIWRPKVLSLSCCNVYHIYAYMYKHIYGMNVVMYTRFVNRSHHFWSVSGVLGPRLHAFR